MNRDGIKKKEESIEIIDYIIDRIVMKKDNKYNINRITIKT